MRIKGIRTWPAEERPRERLWELGPEKISDGELLAIIIGGGTSSGNAVDMARLLLNRLGSLAEIDDRSIRELCQFRGIGLARAAQIKAAFEIGKRLTQQTAGVKPGQKIRGGADVALYFLPHLRDAKKEIFKVLLLDSQNHVIKAATISTGSLNASIVHPREVIKEAIRESAAAMILVHNHPSGDCEPSEDDIVITRRLVEAAKIVGIKVLDHLIIGRSVEGYLSFRDKNIVW